MGAVLGWLERIFVRDFGTKLAAFVVAALLYLVARNEVVRTLEVPLRPIEDPKRVLVTRLPDHVRAVVRGPWGKVAGLDETTVPPLRVRLSEHADGPLVLDARDLTLPPEVQVQRLVYDPVELRFEPVVERPVPVEPRIVGAPAEGYHVVAARADPPRWFVRGAASQVDRVARLTTEPVDVTGARGPIQSTVGLIPPAADVTFLGASRRAVPQVRVSVDVAPSRVRRRVTLSYRAPDGAIDRVAVLVEAPTDVLEELGPPETWLRVAGTARPDARGGAFPVVDFAPEVPASLRNRVRIALDTPRDAASGGGLEVRGPGARGDAGGPAR